MNNFINTIQINYSIGIFDPSNDWFDGWLFKKKRILVTPDLLESHLGDEIVISREKPFENDSTNQFIGAARLVTSWENTRNDFVNILYDRANLISYPVGPFFAFVKGLNYLTNLTNHSNDLNSRLVLRLASIEPIDREGFLPVCASGFKIMDNGKIGKIKDYQVLLSLFPYKIKFER